MSNVDIEKRIREIESKRRSQSVNLKLLIQKDYENDSDNQEQNNCE